ncbi:MAG TPA: hypothetical protein VNB94_00330 [Mycobacteriales bacterium]|nr:hypothetical protein [Mycobacteriales bacterium]
MRSRTVFLLLGALVVAAVVVVPRARREPAYDGPVALAAPGPTVSASAAPQWRAVIAALDQVRAAGFADPSTADPLHWVSADCPCLAVERAALASLVREHRRLEAGAPHLVTVEVVTAAEVAATLRVGDVLPAYDEVDADDRVVRAWPGRAAATWTVTVVRQQQGWRWSAIERAAGAEVAVGVDRSRAG